MQCVPFILLHMICHFHKLSYLKDLKNISYKKINISYSVNKYDLKVKVKPISLIYPQGYLFYISLFITNAIYFYIRLLFFVDETT